MNYNGKNVPEVVIKRLPRYYRYLGDFLKEGITRVSSGMLSERMNSGASQIRQDFNYFGGFGQQGYGYDAEYLHSEIAKILGLNDGYRAVIFGAGHLGLALVNHARFEERGFNIMALFDNDVKKVGNTANGKPVIHIDEAEKYIKENNISIAIIAIPKDKVNEIAPRLGEWGIKGIWNFTSAEIKCDKSVAIENVHMSDSLMTLAYKIKQGDL